MKKCRYMSRKIIVPIFSLLLAVSAFFYAPICALASDGSLSGSTEVTESVLLDSNSAEYQDLTGSLSGSLSGSAYNYYIYDGVVNLGHINFGSDLLSERLYALDITYDLSFTSSQNVLMRGMSLTDAYESHGTRGYKSDLVWSFIRIPSYGDLTKNDSASVTNTYYVTGQQLIDNAYNLAFMLYCPSRYSSISFSCSMNYTINSLSLVSASGSDDYQSGYDAGYTQGFEDGETSGYSDGFHAGVDSVDTDSYYNSGFQAGVDSVDTQSYYDAGYSAGYNVGLQESYDTGYNAGYSDAMSTVESWGADGKNYPLLISNIDTNVLSSIPISSNSYSNGYYPNVEIYRDILTIDNIDPNHTYKVVFSSDDISIDSDSGVYYDDVLFWLVVGGYEYPISGLSDTESFCYISGELMSSTVSFKIGVQLARYVSTSNIDEYLYVDLWNSHFNVYDCGPTGNTQNHIANQTDELTNGYDDSTGQETSSRFSDGIAEYDEVEGSLFTSAKSGLTDYQFFDLESVPAVVTGISFVTATMTGIFNSMGGASGAGIVLSVLFSVMLVSIVAGLYRYFVSSGKGGKHDRKGGKG